MIEPACEYHCHHKHYGLSKILSDLFPVIWCHTITEIKVLANSFGNFIPCPSRQLRNTRALKIRAGILWDFFKFTLVFISVTVVCTLPRGCDFESAVIE